MALPLKRQTLLSRAAAALQGPWACSSWEVASRADLVSCGKQRECGAGCQGAPVIWQFRHWIVKQAEVL